MSTSSRLQKFIPATIRLGNLLRETKPTLWSQTARRLYKDKRPSGGYSKQWWQEHGWYMYQLMPFTPKTLTSHDIFDLDYAHDYQRQKLGEAMQICADKIKTGEKPDAKDIDEFVDSLNFHSDSEKQEAGKMFLQQIQELDLKKLSDISEYEDLDCKNYPNGWAHPRQLFYGKVVGDALGIHPILASLLSPTGGIVGPGDNCMNTTLREAVCQFYDRSILTRHSVVHDAFGRLYNFRNAGPGYTYIDSNPHWPFTPGNPMSDQLDGLSWWAKRSLVHPPHIEGEIKSVEAKQSA